MIRVQAVYALPERQTVVELDVPEGSTVRDVLDQLRAQPPFSSLDLDTTPVGIHGERVDRQRRLAQGDRVELYRPLEVDPKEARRRRARDG